MEDDLNPFDFVLAENLGMTLAQLNDQMSQREYLAWRAFSNYRAAKRKGLSPRGR